ncbi:MAG: amidase family protein [Methanobacteriota archaeon]
MRALLAFALVAPVLAGCLAVSPNLDPARSTNPLGANSAVCGGTVRGIDLNRATMRDLQQALSEGRLTSIDLVDAYVGRIEAFDNAGPKLNSIQTINGMAREQAAAMDAERSAGHVRGPPHGIPILLKDNIGTHDMPTTAGSIALEMNTPPRDATLTSRLREAGAVILGKAQLSEFAGWMSSSPSMPQGYSSLGGQVIHAYSRTPTPGGSSSGSGVATSMAFAGGAIGTETGDSILEPSDRNSVVGLRTTLGLISRAGLIPFAQNFDVTGPMVRNVEDAAAILSAIAGTDERDAVTAESDSHRPPGGDYTAGLSRKALEGVRLGFIASDGNGNDRLFARALADLEALGAILVPISDNGESLASLAMVPLTFNEFKFGINRYLAEEASPALAVSDLTDIILFNQKHPDKVRYGQDRLIASDATPGSGSLAKAASVPAIAANRAAADALFADNNVDAIIGPDAPFVFLGSAAGYPTIVVPSGYNGENPQGLSFFGQAWSEDRLLAYAYAYEQATLRRVAPTLVNPSLLDDACAGHPPPPNDLPGLEEPVAYEFTGHLDVAGCYAEVDPALEPFVRHEMEFEFDVPADTRYINGTLEWSTHGPPASPTDLDDIDVFFYDAKGDRWRGADDVPETFEFELHEGVQGAWRAVVYNCENPPTDFVLTLELS